MQHRKEQSPRKSKKVLKVFAGQADAQITAPASLSTTPPDFLACGGEFAPAPSPTIDVMEQRTLGSSGLTVGALGFGCWRFAGVNLDLATERIIAALDSGMTLIDTADVYGLDNDCPWGAAEELLGSVLRNQPSLRERMVLATKGGIQLERGIGMGVPYESGSDYILNACDRSLERLGIDRIDLYQIHRPDLLAHPGDTANGLAQLVETGRVRCIGVSNYSVSQVNALRAYLPDDVDLITVQPEFSAAHLNPIDDGVLDQAMELGLTPLAWSPLAGGALVSEPTDERIAAIQTVLDELAASYGGTRTQIALSFMLAHPAGVIPIIGTGKPERILEAAAASEIEIAKDDCYRIIAAAGRHLP
jgi:aryl-alcohol dehydrogenase-like predicted oxidoreductase